METAANCLIAPVTSRVIRMPSFGRIYNAPTLILSAIRHHFRRNQPLSAFESFASREHKQKIIPSISTNGQFKRASTTKDPHCQ